VVVKCRHLANLLFDKTSGYWAQITHSALHLPGVRNKMADSLKRKTEMKWMEGMEWKE
jgi:hypothetical protein